MKAARLLGMGLLLSLTVWCGVRQVDDQFQRSNLRLDLQRPETFVSDTASLASGAVPLQWTGAAPLVIDKLSLQPGDLVKLRLRSVNGTTTIKAAIDSQQVTTLKVSEHWQEYELVAAQAGTTVSLSQAGNRPAPVRISRVSISNVTGFADWPVTAWVRSQRAPPPALSVQRVLKVLIVPLVVLLLALWVAPSADRGLVSAAVCLVPGAAIVSAIEGLRLVSDMRIFYPISTWMVLLVVPAVIADLSRRPITLGKLPRAISQEVRFWVTTFPESQEGETPRRVELTTTEVKRATRSFLVMVLLATLLFAGSVVSYFEGPILRTGDTNQWVHGSYYFAQNLSFEPLPHLDLVNDQLAFPYQMNNVFLPWMIEMSYTAWLASLLAGECPWEQLYYLASIMLAALGVFFILLREVGPLRAGLCSLAASFCNFYAIGKYDRQLSNSCVHWTLIAIVLDFVIVQRWLQRRQLSARLIALRLAVAVLSFGLELGYMAGIGLTSLLITMLFMTAGECLRTRCRPRRLMERLKGVLGQLLASFRYHRYQVVLLILIAIFAALLYLPPVLQIAASARQYDFSDVTIGGSWANPLRLFLPVLPGIDLGSQNHLFDDSTIGLFAASPGISFTLIGLLGLLVARQRLLALAPSILLLTIFISFHPYQFDLLRGLPWFAFARVSDRFSVAYPVLLALFACGLPVSFVRSRRGRLVLVVVCSLLAIESLTAYSSYLTKAESYFQPDRAFLDLMQQVRESPGEAVLEWPFYVSAGNGLNGVWPGRYPIQSGTSALQRFHTKKIIGKYFGRLHPDQLQPYLDAGWPRLFFSTSEKWRYKRRQRRDFYPDEWAFLEEFFKRNDFCGIILYTELLPAQTIAGFHRRFGSPAAEAEGYPFNRVQFIPKKVEWRALADRKAGARLALGRVVAPWPEDYRINFGSVEADEYLVSGWSRPHRHGRTSIGQSATIELYLEPVAPLYCTLSATTYETQRVRLLLNGAEVISTTLPGGPPRSYVFQLPRQHLQRHNRLLFELPDAHSPRSVGRGDDRRDLGITVEWLQIAPFQGVHLPLDRRLEMDAEETEELLHQGWSRPRDGARMTVGHSAELRFGLARIAPIVLQMELRTYNRQRVGIELNGVRLTSLQQDGRAFRQLQLVLPEQHLRHDNRLRLHLPDAHSPRSLGRNQDDNRRLGATVRWLRFEIAPSCHPRRVMAPSGQDSSGASRGDSSRRPLR
jgi:hypothetical protein